MTLFDTFSSVDSITVKNDVKTIRFEGSRPSWVMDGSQFSGSSGGLTVSKSSRTNDLMIEVGLKKIAARTVTELWDAIAKVLPKISKTDCRNFFINAGYKPT